MMMEVLSNEVDEEMAPVAAPKLAGFNDWLTMDPHQLSRQLNGWTKAKMALPTPKRSGPDYYRNDLYMGPDPAITDSEDDDFDDETSNGNESTQTQRRPNILPANGDNWHLDLGCCAAAAAASFGSLDTMASLREGVIARPAFNEASDSDDEGRAESSGSFSEPEPETEEDSQAAPSSAVAASAEVHSGLFQEYEDDEDDDEDEGFASYIGFSQGGSMVPFTNGHGNILEEEAF